MLLPGTKTRDTNSPAEPWTRTAKKDVLKGNRKLTPSDFVGRMHVSLKGHMRRQGMASRVTEPKTACPQKKTRREKRLGNQQPED